MRRVFDQFLKVLPAIVVLLCWQIVGAWRTGYEFYVGSPRGVLRELLSLIAAGTFQRDLGVTALEAVLGFALGSTLGTICGLGFWYSSRIYSLARPYITSLASIPVFALGPMLIFWFGTGLLSKVVLGFLSTFAIAVTQAYTGASQADPNLQKLLIVFGATRTQVFLKVIVPSATLWVLAGIRINIGLALLGAFIGEFIASNMGLGNLIIVAEGLYNVNQIWVGVLGIMLIALTLSSLTGPVERRVRRWQNA